MSIILDALKKSESDQQRQSGPALFEVRVAPPKARFPVWAIAIVALLVINMLIVGYLLLRRSSHGDEMQAATPAASPATGSAGTRPATASPPAPTQVPQGQPAVTQPAAGQAAATQLSAGQPITSPPAAGTFAPNATPPGGQLQGAGESGRSPLAESGAPRMSEAEARALEAESRMPGRTLTEPTLANRARDAESEVASGGSSAANADDYAPATEPDTSLFKGHVKRGTASGVPLYQDLAVVPGANLPQLRLDLHVYAANPQDRFALVNMRKVHEGDTVAAGTRVEAITPDGVVLSHDGSKFLLPRE